MTPSPNSGRTWSYVAMRDSSWAANIPPLADRSTSRFQRVMLKLSGQSMQGSRQFGIDPQVVDYMASQVAELVRGGIEVAVAIGGGNIWRGGSAGGQMDRATAD